MRIGVGLVGAAAENRVGAAVAAGAVVEEVKENVGTVAGLLVEKPNGVLVVAVLAVGNNELVAVVPPKDKAGVVVVAVGCG